MQGEVHDVKYARRYVHLQAQSVIRQAQCVIRQRNAQFEICKALCALQAQCVDVVEIAKSL